MVVIEHYVNSEIINSIIMKINNYFGDCQCDNMLQQSSYIATASCMFIINFCQLYNNSNYNTMHTLFYNNYYNTKLIRVIYEII